MVRKFDTYKNYGETVIFRKKKYTFETIQAIFRLQAR